MPDEHWDATLERLGFRKDGYPGHDGMERFPRRTGLPCPSCGVGRLLDQSAGVSELGYVPVKCSECRFTGRRVNLVVLSD
jgi:hypothetical protein